MLVKMLVGIAGPFYTLGPGDEFHFPDDEAARLISANFAIPVAIAPRETADVKMPAMERRVGRPRKQKDVVSDDGSGSGE